MSGRLAVFDLDNTLLTGDSEVLWVEYLLRHGVLDERWASTNAQMDLRYQAGAATSVEFTAFYASTFEGRSAQAWAPWLADFVATVIAPRIPQASRDLVQRHRHRSDLLVLSTAANQALARPTAELLGLEHVIATELGVRADGGFDGTTVGTPNMGEGKVSNLRHWLSHRGLNATSALADAVFYSDSINDLPLLLAVDEPVTVDPDVRLAAIAAARGWPVLQFDRSFPSLPT